MRRPSPPSTPSPSPTSSPSGRRGTVAAPLDPLAELSGRFARFRQEHARGTRVPGELRAGVLAVLRNGVAPGAVYNACGISWSQVAAWKAASADPQAKAVQPEVPAARVFDVIDAPRSEAIPEGRELELRVGSWSVKIRLADDGLVGPR